MTKTGRDEQTWLACDFAEELMQLFDLEQHERRMRLWCAACCRRWWEWLSEVNRAYVVVLERFADGLATIEEVRGARVAVEALAGYKAEVERLDAEFYTRCVEMELGRNDVTSTDEARERLEEAQRRRDGARFVSEIARRAITGATYRWIAYGTDAARVSQILRDIFANPFRPVTLAPSWRTDTAAALARQMYESREFSAMPILADALQDAGCDSADILDHCRGPGPHVRGCWAVDLVLGLG